jgi:serine/threonine protein kinase
MAPMREGRIGARLQHAHVISMFDVVIHEDRPWLVMEYLPSESLAARITREGPLSAVETADIGRQMADGIRDPGSRSSRRRPARPSCGTRSHEPAAA